MLIKVNGQTHESNATTCTQTKMSGRNTEAARLATFLYFHKYVVCKSDFLTKPFIKMHHHMSLHTTATFFSECKR